MSTILSPLDRDDLVARRLASRPHRTSGTRLLHKSCLPLYKDESIPDRPPKPIELRHGRTFVTVPELLVSQATLAHIGYSDPVAAALWATWTQRAAGPAARDGTAEGQQARESAYGQEARETPEGQQAREETPDGQRARELAEAARFLDFAVSHIAGGDTTDLSRQDDGYWRACMDAAGIAAHTRDDIMDPIFRYARLTESWYFWVRDTMETRFRVLVAVQLESRKRETLIRRRASTPFRPLGSNPPAAACGVAREPASLARHAAAVCKPLEGPRVAAAHSGRRA